LLVITAGIIQGSGISPASYVITAGDLKTINICNYLFKYAVDIYLITPSVNADSRTAADPIPSFVLKRVIDLIVPFVAELYNLSLTTGHFPYTFKEPFITPIVKKPGLDSADVSSYRPISNLSVLSKLLERLVDRQLSHFLSSADLLPSLQSGFRPGH